MAGYLVLDTHGSKQFDLLSSLRKPKMRNHRFLRQKDSWNVFSGTWASGSNTAMIYYKDPAIKHGENISIARHQKLTNLSLRVDFTILTETIRPPEGGIIIYTHFKNRRNYYSFHFCLYKDTIQLIKRLKGKWKIISECHYPVALKRQYSVTITAANGYHFCQVSGKPVIYVSDTDITYGSVGLGVKYCDASFSRIFLSLPNQF